MTLKNARFTPPEPDSGGSNLPLLLIASAFLCVTVVLALLQPSLDRTNGDTAKIETAQPAEPEIAQVAAPKKAPVADNDVAAEVVTRTRTPLLSQVATPSAKQYKTLSALITDKIRQPVRLSRDAPSQQDLQQLASQVLAGFTTDVNTQLDPNLVSLIVDSIGQKQSDAYVYVLLNTAAARGRFDIPQALRTASGAMDTHALLTALAQSAGGQPQIEVLPVPLSGTHTVVPEDSLAGIAMRHMGQPMMYLQLMQQNNALNVANPALKVGQVLQIEPN